jgi:hypothetical protein
MPDSQLRNAERRVQPLLRKIPLLQLLILAAAIPLFHYWAIRLPDREELGERSTRVEFEKVHIDSESFGELRLAGAWTLTGDDPRFGGFSALAVDDGELLALTDFGVLARFPKPAGAGATALIRELPSGPGDRRFKRNRDSEALLRDRSGRGWWVAFENRNELWLYDERFSRPLGRAALGRQRWPLNKGIEALTHAGSDILAFPEQGRTVVRLRGLSAQSFPIDPPLGRISDAVQLPDGRIWVLHRNLTPFGFRNSLTELERTAAGYRFGKSLRLGLSPLDNAEALAAERLPNGNTRLWLMTDDNLQRPMRTLLIALDVPPAS